MDFSMNKNTEKSANIFEIELTNSQFKILNQMLPSGYKLELIHKSHNREAIPRASKKIVTNDGNLVNKNTCQNLPNSNLDNISITQRKLRENKGKRHLDVKYNEFDSLPNNMIKGAKPTSEYVKKCFNLIQKLKKHPCSGPFLEPVDAFALGIPDYYQIITEPMDLSTVERNLKHGVYTTTLQFGNDIRKIWNNSFRYNARDSDIYNMTSEMSSCFEKLFKDIENVQLNENKNILQKKVHKLSKSIKEFHSKSNNKSVLSGTKLTKASSVMDKPMTMHEKRALGQNIRNLPPEYLRGVWEIVSEGMAYTQSQKEELEFDIDTLPIKITRELEKYVKAKLAQINKTQNKKKKTAMLTSLSLNTLSSNTPTKRKVTDQPIDTVPKIENVINPMTKTIQNPIDNFEPALKNLESKEDVDSKSSESSFITDSSQSGDSDIEENHQKSKKSHSVDIFHRQTDLVDFQAGGHGSMMNSFMIK